MQKQCSAKAPYNFSAKNITTIDFVSNVKLNESWQIALNNWAQLCINRDHLKTFRNTFRARYRNVYLFV